MTYAAFLRAAARAFSQWAVHPDAVERARLARLGGYVAGDPGVSSDDMPLPPPGSALPAAMKLSPEIREEAGLARRIDAALAVDAVREAREREREWFDAIYDPPPAPDGTAPGLSVDCTSDNGPASEDRDSPESVIF